MDGSSLSAVPFANILPQSLAYLLILLMLFFAELKFLILMKSSLSVIIFLIDHVFGVVSKKLSPYSEVT